MNCFFKDPLSKYNHIMKAWGLRPQQMAFEGDTIQPVMVPFWNWAGPCGALLVQKDFLCPLFLICKEKASAF